MRRRMRTTLTVATAVALALPLAAAPAGADEPAPVAPSAQQDRDVVSRAVAQAAEAARRGGPHTLSAPSSPGQAAGKVGVKDTLDDALGTAADGIPVGLAARVDTPTLHWRGADGQRELGRRAPARPQDRFRVASITKPMVATLVLQEVERGTWTLDTPVVDVVPRLARVIPDRFEDGVTLERLLSHRSGLPDHILPLVGSRMTDPQDYDEYFSVLGEEYTTRDHVRAMDDQPWLFAPGKDFSYSNAGYVMLGMALEKVTGQDLGSLLERRVFRPAGMRHTDFPDDPGTRGPFLVGAAYTGDEGSRWYDLDDFDPSLFDAAGAVTSTATDLERFTDALLTGDLLDERTVAEMTTPRTTGDEAIPDYGLGLYRVPDPCEPGEWLYGHDGAAFGTLSITLSSDDGRRQLSLGMTGRDYTDPTGEAFGSVLAPMLEATC